MAHRNNMVENIGLRGSHFNLGSNNPNPFITTNSTSYNNQEKKKQMPNIKEQDSKSAVNHDKANLRASHFELGNQNPKSFYFTTNSTNLKHHEQYDKAVLSEEQKKELRSHHFKMGQYAPTTQTMNDLNYNKKPIVEMKDQDKLKSFMISHHHNFREMGNTIMTTKYNDDFNNEIDQQALKQGITSEQMKQKALALRSSHIVLGKENPHFQSIQKQDYPEKDNNVVLQKKNFQGSNFELGNQKDPLITTNDIFHNQQPLVNNPVNEQTKLELRSSHFTMGQDNNGYTSTFSNSYNRKSDNAIQKQVINTAALQQNHFGLSMDNCKNEQIYKTSYNSQMKKPNLDDQLAQQRDQKMDRGSNFKIGHQGNYYTSEFNSKFKNQGGGPSTLNAEKKADLRSSHFGFSDVSRNTYQTNYQNTFALQNGDGRGELNAEKKEDLRKQHFNFGNQGTNYTTSAQDFFKHPGNFKPAALNEQQKASLRSHHFQLG